MTAYDNMLEEMQDKMKPVTELAEVNKKAVEKIFALQSGYFADCINASLAQVKALTEVREPQQALELQMGFIKQREAKWTEVTKEELAALNEVREQISSLFEQSLNSLQDLSLFDLTKLDLPDFGLKQFDLSKFDLSNFMPKTAAAEKPAAKPAARKATSASAASTPAAS
ncbi:MAG: phasin family protein [Pseudomonadota bacterium]|jgi:small-conductance mechanosensitive channel|nr:phasin family protein [Pseudomonadota bacterium]